MGLIPADYVVTQVEALTMITHHCLLDHADSSAHKVGVSLSQQQTGVLAGSTAGGGATGSGGQSTEILTNLLHVFMSHRSGH